ncbi:TMEM175 family protein [Haladaptatus caseinilyticus]|uniref:TMEM175 family protein n=1 Tax=Haladaptatus caseinilyticus TaxID=2993314 RepID=UPI00224B529D|nr:TMEM175 family protein [Haladaptatus caseinilyticus]
MTASNRDQTANKSTVEERYAEIDRVKAFSDGVFAIIITLLVLELGVPHTEPGRLLAGLRGEWPSYLAFVLSFVYVGVLWLNHHGLFRHIREMTLSLNWINLGILFGVVIIPFPTAVLATALAGGNYDDLRTAVTFYALMAAIMSAPWLVAFSYLRRHPTLANPDLPAHYFRTQSLRPLTGLVLYSLAAVVGWFVNPFLGLIGIAIMITYHAVTSEGLREGPLGRLMNQ